jgi:hypothetical protein
MKVRNSWEHRWGASANAGPPPLSQMVSPEEQHSDEVYGVVAKEKKRETEKDG